MLFEQYDLYIEFALYGPSGWWSLQAYSSSLLIYVVLVARSQREIACITSLWMRKPKLLGPLYKCGLAVHIWPLLAVVVNRCFYLYVGSDWRSVSHFCRLLVNILLLPILLFSKSIGQLLVCCRCDGIFAWICWQTIGQQHCQQDRHRWGTCVRFRVVSRRPAEVYWWYVGNLCHPVSRSK